MRNELPTFIMSTLGVAIFSIGVVCFTLPYQFPDIGVIGIAVILKYSMGFSPAAANLIINAALLLWGGRQLSKRFIAWTIYNTLLMSLMLGVLSDIDVPYITDTFLVAVAGGLIKGVGLGMVFRTGGSSGGTDIIVAVLRKRFGVEVGKYTFYMNMLILTASVGIVGFEKVLYGFVVCYIMGQAMDNVISSFDKRRLVFIVANGTRVIVDYISKELVRGSTVLYGEGGYTHEKRDTVMCLLTARQAMELKRYLAANYPSAFMVVTDASEVLGCFSLLFCVSFAAPFACLCASRGALFFAAAVISCREPCVCKVLLKGTCHCCLVRLIFL